MGRARVLTVPALSTKQSLRQRLLLSTCSASNSYLDGRGFVGL